MLTSNEIFSNFYGLEHVLLMDKNYAQPTTHWLFQEYRPWFEKKTFELGVSSWRDQWDCDDFASLYRILAQVCHSLTHTRTEEGLAVGEVKYLRESSKQYHMINCAFTEQGLIYIEPQKCLQIHLSETELQSRSYVRF